MTTQYIGARYVPKFYNNNGSSEWTANVPYQPLTVVMYLSNSYTSKISVPANIGNPAENPTYWALTGNYNAQINDIVSNQPFVTPEQFGAKGDGISDDSSAIQQAINSSYNVVFKPTTYTVNTPLVLRSFSTLDLNGATLTGSDSIIYTTTPVSTVTIKNGTIYSSSDSSVEICCYYSTLDNMLFNGGIVNFINGTATGTLVENKILNCTFRGTSEVKMGSGNKLTDGIIDNCIFSCTAPCLTIENSAGWIISNCHFYTTGRSANVLQCYNTQLSNIYLENANPDTSALYCSVQTNLNISNISSLTTGRTLVLERTSYQPTANANITLSNVNFPNGTINQMTTEVTFSGICAGFTGTGKITMLNNQLPKIASYKVTYLASENAQTVTVPITISNDYASSIVKLQFSTGVYWHNPVYSEGLIFISKNNDTPVVTSDLSNIKHATVSDMTYENDTLTFTVAHDSTYYGMLYIELLNP